MVNQLPVNEQQNQSASSLSYSDFLREDFNQLFNALDLDERQRKFLRSRWLDQVLWMEKKAAECRDNYHLFRKTAIILGIIVPIIIGIQTENEQINIALKYVAIILSGMVAICSAIEEFHHYGERWFHYRRTAESLKSQGWIFSQLGGAYKSYNSHKDAFNTFAEQVEEILERDVEYFVTQMNRKDKSEDNNKQEEGSESIK